MAAIYIASEAGAISKSGETLVFTPPDETKTILFPFKIELLFIMGNISVSGAALRMFAKYKLPVIFLSSNGKFNAKLVYGDSKNVFLRQKQYAILSDKTKSLEIAKAIVAGKLKNEISFMRRINRKSDKENARIEQGVEKIKRHLAQVEKAADMDSLRGFEGAAARAYFETFAYNIICPWAEFKGRSKNPPRSNVNAVLSFLYTILMYRVDAAIESQGLDSMVGNLHACDYGRDALVFDLMEEFRTPIADAVCCSLFNLGILKEDNFRSVNFSKDDDDLPLEAARLEIEGDEAKSGDGADNTEADAESESRVGILLTKDGIKKVVKAFEEKMTSVILYDGERISYQKIIIRQAQHYKRVVSGEESAYRSFYFK